MRLGHLRVARKRRLVRGNRIVDIARVGELHAALQNRAGVFPQGRDRGEHRIDERRPTRPVLVVERQRRSCRVHSPERSIGQRQCVVRCAQLGEERHGAGEVFDGRVVLPFGRGDASEPDFGGWTRGWLAGERAKARLAFPELADSSSASASFTRAAR